MKASSGSFVVSTIAVLLLMSPRAEAGEPRTHDGFFLRFSAGGGPARTEFEGQGTTAEVSGGAGDLNIAIGAAITRNLIVHGTYFGWLVSDPDVTIGGVTGTANLDADVSALGAGLTYYFMPLNAYVSASAGGGKLTMDGGGFSGSTETGFMGEVTVGKEWWVSGKLGL